MCHTRHASSSLLSDKILVIENLIDVADRVMLIGGMAYTFMKVGFGMEIGKSLFDKKGAELVPKLLEKAKAKGCEVVLPVDWACGQDFCNDQVIQVSLAHSLSHTYPFFSICHTPILPIHHRHFGRRRKVRKRDFSRSTHSSHMSHFPVSLHLSEISCLSMFFFCNDQEIKHVTQAEGIPEGWEGMDCGPESMKLFREKILSSKTVRILAAHPFPPICHTSEFPHASHLRVSPCVTRHSTF